MPHPLQASRNSLLLTLGLLLPLSNGAAQSSASAQPVPDEEKSVQLPAFSVSADKADPYHTTDVTSIARVAGSILDSPFTVNVVPRELMDDLGANSLYDVNRYFAGLSAGRGAGIGGINDRQDFRGFESFTKTVDNFSQALFPVSGTSSSLANFDPAFVERQELVMGPDSILSPTGTPGGSVNIITKSPKFTQSIDLTGVVGNYNADKWTVDATGPINQHLAYRVILNYQDATSEMPGDVRQQDVGLGLTYKFTEDSQLTFKYFGVDWGQYGELSVSNNWGEMVYTPDAVGGKVISNAMNPGFGYRSFNGAAPWGHNNVWMNTAESEFTTTLFQKVKARFAGEWSGVTFGSRNALLTSSPADTAWDAAGNVTAVSPGTLTNLASAPAASSFAHYYWRGFQLQNDYAANFQLGNVSLQPVAGWSLQQGHTLYLLSGQDKNPLDIPNVNLLANNGAQLGGASGVPLANYTTGYSNTPGMGTLKQEYVVTKAGFVNNRIFITGGASRTGVNIDTYKTTTFVPNPNGQGIAQPTGPYSQVKLISKKDNYLGGFLAKPTENTSIYYTYSSNANIVSGGDLSPLWQTGKQHEFGVKSEFFDKRISVNVDHFQIVQTNISTPNPVHNVDLTAPNNILGDATSKGYELNVAGGVTKNLSIIASLTDMKYRDAFGRRVRNVPDHMANLLANYHFTDGALKGASVFAGVVRVGVVAGETVTGATTAADVAAGHAPAAGIIEQPGFYLPAWTVVNAGSGYTWSRYRVNLNVDNALNARFLWQPAGRNSVPGYPGLTARVTFNIHI